MATIPGSQRLLNITSTTLDTYTTVTAATTVTAGTGMIAGGKVSSVTAGTANTDAVNLLQLNNATTGVLVYQGTWNASTNSPSLSSGVGTAGYYYIVSTAGTTNLDGESDWAIGDWAVFQSTWSKIDNSQVGNVIGSGVDNRLTLWNGTSDVDSNSNFFTTGTTLVSTQLAVGDGTDGYFFSDTAGRTAFGGGSFYIQDTVGTYYNYATNQYHGNSSGDNHYFRANYLGGDNWNISTTGDLTLGGGDLILGGTGRIQGVDTVSSSTDAANKAYVDAAAAAVPIGNYVTLATAQTITGAKTIDTLKIGSANKIQFANNDFIRYEDATGVGRFHFDSDGGTNNSSVQAATFVGALSGNAATATIANLASKVSINSDFSGTHPMLVEVEASGMIYNNPSLTYNGTSNTLTSPNFAGNVTGNLTGNASSATTAAAYLPLAGGTMTGLPILGNVGSDQKIQFQRTGGNVYSIEHNSSQLYFYNRTTTESPLLIQNDGDVLMNAGNVGIGGGTISSRLSVNTDTVGDSYFRGGAWNSSFLDFSTFATASLNAGHLINATSFNGEIAFATGGSEHIRIASTGNVGIGTTSPRDTLEIKGNMRFVNGEDHLLIKPNSAIHGADFIVGDGVDPADTPIMSLDGLSGNTKVYGDFEVVGKANIGILGNYSPTLGSNSLTVGYFSTSQGANSFSAGNSVSAIGENSVATGRKTTAFNVNSFATGEETRAAGKASFTTGKSTRANGVASSAFGQSSISNGNHASAFGAGTIAAGNDSFASGNSSESNGSRAFATGLNTVANGPNSFTAGRETKAEAPEAFAIGNNTTASGINAFASGAGTIASGYRSAAFGYYSIARFVNSVAMGKEVVTNTPNSIAVGKHNDFSQYTNQTKFVVGIGSSDTDRENGFIVTNLGKFIMPKLATSPSYTNDASAATGGVTVGELYRNGSAVNIRVS